MGYFFFSLNDCINLVPTCFENLETYMQPISIINCLKKPGERVSDAF